MKNLETCWHNAKNNGCNKNVCCIWWMWWCWTCENSLNWASSVAPNIHQLKTYYTPTYVTSRRRCTPVLCFWSKIANVLYTYKNVTHLRCDTVFRVYSCCQKQYVQRARVPTCNWMSSSCIKRKQRLSTYIFASINYIHALQSWQLAVSVYFVFLKQLV
jgi:hypothetical protein